MSRLLVRFAAPVLILILAGCTAHRSYREAQTAEKFGDWDRAVILYLELLEERPDNVAYRSGLLRAKIRASQNHFEKAKKYRDAGAREQALAEFRQAVQLDPTNQYAQVELEKLRAEMAARRAEEATPSSLQELKEKTHGARPQPPILSPRSSEPISLDFPKPVSVFDIYKALGKAFGINILFDPKLRPQEIAIELRDVVAQDALEILMRTANHFYKVLDAHTIIVVEDNPQNRRNYEDLVIQTFFLSNAEPKDVMTMLRSLVGAKNIAANDQLNAIVLRDTADKVKVAERIILTNDKSRGEVVIDVELLQINTSRLQELGISLSEYRVTQVLENNDAFRVSDLEFINQASWILNLPSLIYDFVKNSSEAQLLASPQIRISDGEQATLHIGDRVPIPVTTFNTGQTIGGNIVPITSFQYQDIGIRLDITPRIHHNQQVSLELSVEVSNLSGFVEGSGGQQQPIIGTRTIESTIRLQDGETNFLAGLIRTDETNTESGMPGLSEVPVLGRLFSKKTTNKGRTDLVLTLTPHVVRTPDITEQDLLPIWVGTEANITFRGGSPRVESEVEGPFDEDEEGGAERIREMIRRRIQNLPRGLRGAAGEEEEEPEERPGVELVPAAPPTDPFRRPQPEDEEEPPEGASLELPEEDEQAIFSAAALQPVFPEPVASPAALASTAPPQEKLEAPRAPLLASEPAPGAPAATLSLQPRGSEVRVGATLELDLLAETTVAVSHFPITLDFDPAILEVRAVEAGEFLGPPSLVEVLSDTSTPGRLVLGASRLGRSEGATGSGLVARIALRALAPGATRIRFEKGKALGPGLAAVEPIVTRPARVRVTSERDAPDEPQEPAPGEPQEPAPGAADQPAEEAVEPARPGAKQPEGP